MTKRRGALAELHQLIVDFETYLERIMLLRQGTLEISGTGGRVPDMLGWRLDSNLTSGSDDQPLVDSFAYLGPGSQLGMFKLSGYFGRLLVTGVS